MRRAVFLGIWLTLFLLRVDAQQVQSYVMTDGQTITTCTGDFYDPGGQNGSYDNGLDYTQTFKSSSPYLCLKVTFTMMGNPRQGRFWGHIREHFLLFQLFLLPGR